MCFGKKKKKKKKEFLVYFVWHLSFIGFLLVKNIEFCKAFEQSQRLACASCMISTLPKATYQIKRKKNPLFQKPRSRTHVPYLSIIFQKRCQSSNEHQIQTLKNMIKPERFNIVFILCQNSGSLKFRFFDLEENSKIATSDHHQLEQQKKLKKLPFFLIVFQTSDIILSFYYLGEKSTHGFGSGNVSLFLFLLSDY